MTARFLIGSLLTTCVLLSVTAVYSSTYIVQKNDTLWSIARKFGVQSDKISKINDLPVKNRLKPGQKLVIPDRIVVYTVKNGDNLTRIASENQSRLPYIILFNNLPDEKIYPGMKIGIPVTETGVTIITAPVTRVTAAVHPKKSVAYHKVVKGDTLTSLSEQFNVSISEIMDWNGKKNASLFIGERLKIYSDAQEKKDEMIAVADKNGDTAPKTAVKMSNPGSFVFPISPERIDRISHSGRGIIVYTDAGTDISSIQNGVVEYAGKMTGYNSVVIVNYGGDERAIFGFLNDVRVREGDSVGRGQAIGSVSQATYLGQIQFYFELRKGKENVNVFEVFPSLKNRDFYARR